MTKTSEIQKKHLFFNHHILKLTHTLSFYVMVESKFDIDRSKNKSLSHGDNLLIISSLNVEKHIWLLNIVHMANVKYNILELSIGRVST